MTQTTVDTAPIRSPATQVLRTTVPRGRRTVAPYLFSAPAVLLYVAFTFIPIVYTSGLSLFAQRLSGGGVLGTRTTTFVGLRNYLDVLDDAELLAGLGRLAVYGIIAVPLTIGLALLFALLLDVPTARFRRLSRIMIFVPYAVPGVVAALMWGFMYLPGTSPFSYVTRALGLGSIPFLGPRGLFGAFANISVWGGVGFTMLVIYTALRSIPDELVDAARLDGAGEVAIALRIKVPLVRPALMLTSIFGLLGALQLYGEPATMKPLTVNITDTWAPLMTIYRDAFALDNLPAAAAASMVLAFGTAAVSVAVLAIVRGSGRRSG